MVRENDCVAYWYLLNFILKKRNPDVAGGAVGFGAPVEFPFSEIDKTKIRTIRKLIEMLDFLCQDTARVRGEERKVLTKYQIAQDQTITIWGRTEVLKEAIREHDYYDSDIFVNDKLTIYVTEHACIYADRRIKSPCYAPLRSSKRARFIQELIKTGSVSMQQLRRVDLYKSQGAVRKEKCDINKMVKKKLLLNKDLIISGRGIGYFFNDQFYRVVKE